jgi:hypothetical protein
VVVAIYAILCAAGVSTASAAGGHILFAAYSGGQSSIGVIDADGSNQKPILASSTGQLSNPAWSPDGTQVAYVNTASGGYRIWVADADGSKAMAVSSGGQDFWPSWSPDGKSIVFDSSRSGSYQLWVVGADGSNEHQLTSSGMDKIQPSWGPSDAIAFAGVNPDGAGAADIFVLSADRQQLTRLTHDAARAESLQPSWSPDGTKVAFTSSRDGHAHQIWLVDGDGANARQLTSSVGTKQSPTWSSDGAQLAYSTVTYPQSDPGTVPSPDSPGPTTAVYRINFDGTAETGVTDPSLGASMPAWHGPAAPIGSGGGTSSELPAVVTGEASDITDTSASLHGTINPRGSDTRSYVEYGADTTYGHVQPLGPTYHQDGAEIGDIPRSESITGLQAETAYHYRFVAINANGTTAGQDREFSTAKCVSACPDTPDVLDGTGRYVEGQAGYTTSGIVASFFDRNARGQDAQASPGEFSASIDWGDGKAGSTGTITIDQDGKWGNFDVYGSHQYQFPGDYSAEVRITKTAGPGSGEAAYTSLAGRVVITAVPVAYENRIGQLIAYGLDHKPEKACTATVVGGAANQSVILTAAHCAVEGGGHYNSWFDFGPGHQGDSNPYGVWRAQRSQDTGVFIDYDYMLNGNHRVDYAFVVLGPQNGIPVEKAIGGIPIAYNPGRHQGWTAYGYPGTPTLQSCTSDSSDDYGDDETYGPQQMVMHCPALGEGASGGPWINNDNLGWSIGAVNSVGGGDCYLGHFGHCDLTGTYLGKEAKASFELASHYTGGSGAQVVGPDLSTTGTATTIGKASNPPVRRVDVTLTSVGAGKAARMLATARAGHRRLVFGHASVNVQKGHTVPIKVRINRQARALLKRAHHIRVRVVLTLLSPHNRKTRLMAVSVLRYRSSQH